MADNKSVTEPVSVLFEPLVTTIQAPTPEFTQKHPYDPSLDEVSTELDVVATTLGGSFQDASNLERTIIPDDDKSWWVIGSNKWVRRSQMYDLMSNCNMVISALNCWGRSMSTKPGREPIAVAFSAETWTAAAVMAAALQTEKAVQEAAEACHVMTGEEIAELKKKNLDHITLVMDTYRQQALLLYQPTEGESGPFNMVSQLRIEMDRFTRLMEKLTEIVL